MIPWKNFVVAVALLGCNAMALSGFDFARPYLSLASTQRAEAKGLQLLLANLTQEQRVRPLVFLMWLARKQLRGGGRPHLLAPMLLF
jgi:hypothetical protein